MTKMTGAQIVMECLAREGVEYIFGIPGGANLPLYDTLPQYPQIRHILVRHEQAAAHAADAYARVTGKAGVCWATSGPGATNLVTGIANASMDSVPLVCITGAVVSWLIGRDGFQEADITGITIPITKQNYLVLDVDDLAQTVREAFHIATTGRPGPVLIDIPRDIQQQQTEFHYPEKVDIPSYRPVTKGHPGQIRKAAQLIAEAERPLILAGHGVVLARAYDELRELAERAHIPVICTLLGIGGFPGSHELYLGMPGMHGMYWNNIAISEADLIIGIGMRFDDRVTGRLKDFAPNARIIHIDVDPAEIGKNVRTTVPIVGDVKEVLSDLNPLVQPARHDAWCRHIQEIRREHPSITIPNVDKVLPQFVIKKIYELSGPDAYFVTGVGQHQMWAAQFFWGDNPGSFVTSGGLGTMGFEVPAAMGVQFARPKDLVWSICGDGGFQMTMQEMATIVEHELPIKFAIINNGHLGMVRQWQHLFYDDNLQAVRLFHPDYVKLAEAFGAAGLRVTDKIEVEPAIEKALRHPGPVIIDFHVEQHEDIYPMMPPGASLAETVDQPEAEREAKPEKVRSS
ncbi:MAG: acetolactate synthase, large subunit, biosynthetic type [Chloroflexi bacterium RBG_16_68_14]|nr:MAG: acetolactate synthase, large subunit, biosynthetic type [Chloroflexi bacterium RBG_16_68_14]